MDLRSLELRWSHIVTRWLRVKIATANRAAWVSLLHRETTFPRSKTTSPTCNESHIPSTALRDVHVLINCFEQMGPLMERSFICLKNSHEVCIYARNGLIRRLRFLTTTKTTKTA